MEVIIKNNVPNSKMSNSEAPKIAAVFLFETNASSDNFATLFVKVAIENKTPAVASISLVNSSVFKRTANLSEKGRFLKIKHRIQCL